MKVDLTPIQFQTWIVIAAYLSWTTHHSFGWCIFHGICNLVYIFYWLWTNSIT